MDWCKFGSEKKPTTTVFKRKPTRRDCLFTPAGFWYKSRWAQKMSTSVSNTTCGPSQRLPFYDGSGSQPRPQPNQMMLAHWFKDPPPLVDCVKQSLLGNSCQCPYTDEWQRGRATQRVGDGQVRQGWHQRSCGVLSDMTCSAVIPARIGPVWRGPSGRPGSINPAEHVLIGRCP